MQYIPSHAHFFAAPPKKNILLSLLIISTMDFCYCPNQPSDLSPHNEFGPAAPIAVQLTTTRMKGAERKVRKYGVRFLPCFFAIEVFN
jgi:hypothetical protein